EKKKIARALEVCKGRQRHDERESGDEMYAEMDGKVRQEQRQHKKKIKIKKTEPTKRRKRLIHKTAIIIIMTIAMANGRYKRTPNTLTFTAM
ncbi:hypothetical protein RFI_38659, partial [Reticulomyxa filosa]